LLTPTLGEALFLVAATSVPSFSSLVTTLATRLWPITAAWRALTFYTGLTF